MKFLFSLAVTFLIFVVITPGFLRFAPAALRIWAELCAGLSLPRPAKYWRVYADKIEVARSEALAASE